MQLGDARAHSATANRSSPSREIPTTRPECLTTHASAALPTPQPGLLPRQARQEKQEGNFWLAPRLKRLLVHLNLPHAGIPSDQEDPRSGDELLQSPKRKGVKEKRQETVSSKPSHLPRVYVEIISPAPHPSKRLPAKTNADPSSPTPTRPKALRRNPPSPSRSPVSLRKTTASRMSPSKRLGQPASRGTQSSITQNSPGYPPWCLHAQKRSIFHALHDPKTAVFDREDENGAPSANAVALEQLNALFAGTSERSEGNSCLLIGPRGSGKSRVSIYASGTDTA
jgi:hypothetical protein